jgi:hypothetical protein
MLNEDSRERRRLLSEFESFQVQGEDIVFYLEMNHDLWNDMNFAYLEGELHVYVTSTSELAAYKLLYWIGYRIDADIADFCREDKSQLQFTWYIDKYEQLPEEKDDSND